MLIKMMLTLIPHLAAYSFCRVHRFIAYINYSSCTGTHNAVQSSSSSSTSYSRPPYSSSQFSAALDSALRQSNISKPDSMLKAENEPNTHLNNTNNSSTSSSINNSNNQNNDNDHQHLSSSNILNILARLCDLIEIYVIDLNAKENILHLLNEIQRWTLDVDNQLNQIKIEVC